MRPEASRSRRVWRSGILCSNWAGMPRRFWTWRLPLKGTRIMSLPVCWGRSLEMPRGFAVSVIVPDYELATKQARAVLPDCCSMADAVFNLQRSTLLVAALARGDSSVFPMALEDRVHQPFRARLIPGLEEILVLRKPGLLGCALSGAGPAVLVFHKPGAEEVCESVRAVFARNGCAAEVMPVGACGKGLERG